MENIENTKPMLSPVPEQLKIDGPKKINIKTAAITALIIVVGGLIFFYRNIFVAAMIDGNPISRFSVIQKTEKMSGKKALDEIIVQNLIEAEARKKKIIVNDKEIQDLIVDIDSQLKAQGITLEEALKEQGLNRKDFIEQIKLQKIAEKILADKIQVADAEVVKYIKDNEITIPAGQETSYKAQLKKQMQGDKLNQEMGAWIASLKSQAKINYFVNY